MLPESKESHGFNRGSMSNKKDVELKKKQYSSDLMMSK